MSSTGLAAIVAASDRRGRRQWALALAAASAAVAVILGLGSWLGLTPAGLIGGLGSIGQLVGQMVPPRALNLAGSLHALLDTYLYALAGTALGFVFGALVALGAAAPTAPHPLVRVLARAVAVSLRAVPDLVFALIFVATLGLGPAAGVLALAAHSTGVLSRQLADALEDLDPGPSLALQAAGASRLQVAVAGLLARIAPVALGLTLFRLEINVRTSVVLGFVGAGGIGLLLQDALGTLQFPIASTYILEIMALVLVSEQLSEALRRRVVGRRAPPWRAPRLGAVAARRLPWLAGLAALGVVVIALRTSGLDVADLWRVPTDVARAVPSYVPHAPADLNGALVQLGQTFAIGAIATAAGYLVALVLGFAAAGKLGGGRRLAVGVRVLLTVLRAIPELVLALVFVAAVGLGPTAGVYALGVMTAAFGGKLIAETLADSEHGSELALQAAGAGAGQVAASATLPTAIPALAALGLFCLDVNVRAAVLLGIVGAGGIGFDLLDALRVYDYHQAGFLLLEILLLVFAIEAASVVIRRRLGPV